MSDETEAKLRRLVGDLEALCEEADGFGYDSVIGVKSLREVLRKVEEPEDRIRVGAFYEGCSFHPLVCIVSDYEEDHLEGISLVDGRHRCCSVSACGVRKLTSKEAITWRDHGPQDIPEELGPPTSEWEPEGRWWERPFRDAKTERDDVVAWLCYQRDARDPRDHNRVTYDGAAEAILAGDHEGFAKK